MKNEADLLRFIGNNHKRIMRKPGKIRKVEVHIREAVRALKNALSIYRGIPGGNTKLALALVRAYACCECTSGMLLPENW